MKIKTSELIGPALDWAVAHVERKFSNGPWEDFRLIDGQVHLRYCGAVLDAAYDPSTDWGGGGPIIEREKIAVRFDYEEQEWHATIPSLADWTYAWGKTPLIAAMRCFIASKLGDEIEISEELCKK